MLSLINYIEKHRDWSIKTFGTGNRRVGIAMHIVQEVEEVLSSRGELEEWIDIIILALDGAWRSGNSPQSIVDALELKQEKNFRRSWPDKETLGQNEPSNHTGE